MPHSDRLALLTRVSPARTAKLCLESRRFVGLCGHGFQISNTGTMEIGERVRIGTAFYGFTRATEPGLLRNRGTLRLGNDVGIGSGNRWDIGPGAIVEVGDGTYFSPFTKLISSTGISIGSRCAVAWDVQFLDDDFHAYHPDAGSTPPRTLPITIGDHVWIGSGAKIYKGVSIADDCIVAGGAVVTRSFTEPGTLIGGVPARAVRPGVSWT